MGISNLLPFLRPITTEANVSKYRGNRVGVDAMCWMHRGAVACAAELAHGKNTDKFLKFFINMLQLLVQNGITPVIVFDGMRIPAKSHEEEARKLKRDESRTEGIRMISEDSRNARDKDVYAKLVAGISVTSEMVDRVINACKILDIQFVVAPFEADAQLAYMCRSGYVRAVITEDSDLLAYGCPRVLFKMDKTGLGQEIDIRSIAAPVTELEGVDPSSEWKGEMSQLKKFDQKMFTGMCVLSGSDYSVQASIKGMGIKTAYNLIARYRSLSAVFRNIAFDPKWKAKLPKDVSEYNDLAMIFKKAEAVFFRHIVMDLKTNHLTDMSHSYLEVPSLDIDVGLTTIVGEYPKNYDQIMKGIISPKDGAQRAQKLPDEDYNVVLVYKKTMANRSKASLEYVMAKKGDFLGKGCQSGNKSTVGEISRNMCFPSGDLSTGVVEVDSHEACLNRIKTLRQPSKAEAVNLKREENIKNDTNCRDTYEEPVASKLSAEQRAIQLLSRLNYYDQAKNRASPDISSVQNLKLEETNKARQSDNILIGTNSFRTNSNTSETNKTQLCSDFQKYSHGKETILSPSTWVENPQVSSKYMNDETKRIRGNKAISENITNEELSAMNNALSTSFQKSGKREFKITQFKSKPSAFKKIKLQTNDSLWS